jgi:hypothetical protein
MTSPRDAAGSSATGQFENGEHHTKKRASRAVDTAVAYPENAQPLTERAPDARTAHAAAAPPAAKVHRSR